MKVARTIIFTLLILGVAAVLIVKHQGAGNSVAAQAIADAEKQGKPAWLFIHTSNDPTCMAVEIIFNGLQTEFAGKIVFIDVNFDDPAEQGIIKKYDVRLLPTSVFFDGDGNLVDKKVGPKPADEYKDTLVQLLEIS